MRTFSRHFSGSCRGPPVDAAFITLLRKYRIAWVVADTPRPWPLSEDVTADFIYMRLHGSTELYNSRYTSEELRDDIRADPG